jgi:Tfp pilus assembly protein PilW
MKLSFRRVLILFAAILFALATGITAAQAATNFNNAPNGAHYAKGSGEPVCTVTGTTVSCTGTAIEGVGNTNATVTLAVTSTISGVCHNPGTNSKVVEPFSRSVTTNTSSNLTSTKNGRLVVPAQTTTGTSDQQFLATFKCPNPNWTPEVTSNVLSFRYTLVFAGFTDPAILITG